MPAKTNHLKAKAGSNGTVPEYRIMLDNDRFTLGDQIDLEESTSTRDWVSVLSRHVIDRDGEFVDQETGYMVLRSFSVNQIINARENMLAFLEEAKETAEKKGK